MKDFERKSPFEFNESYISQNVESELFDQFILPWAQGMQGNSILDLGGGTGVEGNLLRSKSYDVYLADLSLTMLNASDIQKKIQADAELLPFTNQIFSGVIFKDVWIFLSPSQRSAVLSEMKRVLEKNGSIFLMSQYGSATRIYYIPRNSKYPQKSTCNSFDEFVCSYEKLTNAGDQIISIEHRSTIEDTAELAEQVGLSMVKSDEYAFDSKLAEQNRWISRSGFMIELQKDS